MANLAEAHRLHEKDEPRLRDYAIYSMLDLMGGEVVCDFCGRWQRIPSLFPGDPDIPEMKASRGWTMLEEKDCCPVCSQRKTEPDRR